MIGARVCVVLHALYIQTDEYKKSIIPSTPSETTQVFYRTISNRICLGRSRVRAPLSNVAIRSQTHITMKSLPCYSSMCFNTSIFIDFESFG